jgi:glycosyltransferase involved in cell wall biosynthesis
VKFSICIPNYNYARYLGVTLRSALDQTYGDFEVLVSDNASTDASVDVVRAANNPRIRLRVNERNVGFAANLDRVGSMATGERMILLSSDDLIEKEALATYARLLEALPNGGANAVITSGQYFIDSEGKLIDTHGVLGPPIFLPGDRAPALDGVAGGPVYRVAGKELLRRCLLMMQNPFYFAATCYPRTIYEALGGYTVRRLYNPDKWFNWRMLELADEAYFVDRPLFSYRWHTSNQLSQQKGSGALKFLVDEYLSTLEISNETLAAIGLSRADLERAFVEYDIGRHGLAELARHGAAAARRILNFGRGVYPEHARRNRKVLALRMAVPFGPLAQLLARRLYQARSFRSQGNVLRIPGDRAARPRIASDRATSSTGEA